MNKEINFTEVYRRDNIQKAHLQYPQSLLKVYDENVTYIFCSRLLPNLYISIKQEIPEGKIIYLLSRVVSCLIHVTSSAGIFKVRHNALAPFKNSQRVQNILHEIFTDLLDGSLLL